MQEVDCDLYAISCHKMYGPTGLGVLYGKKKWLDELPPYQGGGGMIKEVKKDTISYGDLPNKYEAGEVILVLRETCPLPIWEPLKEKWDGFLTLIRVYILKILIMPLV